MDIGTIGGLIGGTVAIIMCVVTSGGQMSGILDLPSGIFVVGGSFFALMMSAPMKAVMGMFKVIGRTFKVMDFGEKTIIQTLVGLSEKARREGILALEEGIDEIGDKFLQDGLRLVVDGTDGAIVRVIMENEMSQSESRHFGWVALLNGWGGLAPGYGMMGTVIGLIGMLRNLEDKSALGPNMAVALITTLYGSLVANWWMTPFGQKLMKQNAAEMMTKEMIIEGVLSIQAGDSPRILAMKLITYLDPSVKKAVAAEVLTD